MQYHSDIILGAKYLDKRSGIEGHATIVLFNENGCIEVGIEQTIRTDGKIEVKNEYFNELRLELIPGSTDFDGNEYISDIKLGEKYRDIQTGLEGHACTLEFHEFQANRVTLRSVGYDKDGSKKLIYHSIDDFLLEHMETGVRAERTTDKRSPVTREVERR